MEFSSKMREFSKRIEKIKGGISTEEATKTSLVLPFFNLLGYDVFNPLEFCPEYIADVGIKKGEKIDYAVMHDGIPQIFIECKSCSDNLDKHGSQLYRYFGTTKTKFGILTNGIIYRFYTDLEEVNKMDLTPFLEIDLLDIKDAQLNELKKFAKENFDTDKIFSTASELKYSNLIKNYLAKEMESPSDEFARHILGFVYEGQRTQKIIEKHKPLIKKAFNSFISEIVNHKISSALSTDESEPIAENEPQIKEQKIITTEEELQAFYVVKAIAAEVTDSSNIYYRDTESYFGILFQDNNRKPICRINLDKKQKRIMIPDANRIFLKYNIDKVDDIYNFKDEISKAIKVYTEKSL